MLSCSRRSKARASQSQPAMTFLFGKIKGQIILVRFPISLAYVLVMRLFPMGCQTTIGGSGESLPNDESAVARAWASAAQLGLDTNQLKMKNWTSHVCGFDEHGHENIERRIGGRGVFLSRKVDGLLFFATGDDGWNEGFWIEFGSQGNIRAFSINWPGLQRFASHPTADPQQIVACIRARKIFVLPNANEENYSKRIKTLSDAKKIIITKMTPYYGEGIYGETPRDDEPPKWVRPVAELEAVGSFGNSNAVFRILSPILLEDAQRLLKAKDM